jgi:hypothetical protein
MNIFRLLGDFSHLASFFFLIFRLREKRNAVGAPRGAGVGSAVAGDAAAAARYFCSQINSLLRAYFLQLAAKIVPAADICEGLNAAVRRAHLALPCDPFCILLALRRHFPEDPGALAPRLRDALPRPLLLLLEVRPKSAQ